MRLLAAAAVDAAAITAFGSLGRAWHGRTLSVGDVLATAAPFLAGSLLGHLAGRSWRQPAAPRTGLFVWAGTLAGGMALRALVGRPVPLTFVITAGLALAVLLLGWRALALLVGRATSRP